MKKITYSLLLVISFSAQLPAQWINNIQYYPSNPTSADTVSVYVSLSFPSGTCDQHTQGYFINGNKIEAFALHCLGMLTYICNHTDTFKLNPLPAGAYTFRFQLDAGMLPFPCTPGIIPGPADSVSFFVTPVTGIQQLSEESIQVMIHADELTVSTVNQEECFFALYDLNGKLIYSERIRNRSLKMNTAALSSGKYIYSISAINKVLKEGTFTKP